MGEYGSLQTRILAYNLLSTDGSVTVLSNVSQTYKKCLHKQMYFHFNRLFFNPLKAWWEGGSIRSSLWFFLKCIFQRERERMKSGLFVTFNHYKLHLSWRFHWNCSSCLEDMKIFSTNISYFHQFFGFFDISLLQRN